MQGVCCSSRALDAAGYCCASGLLDECGVCDGDSASCALRSTVSVQARISTDIGSCAWLLALTEPHTQVSQPQSLVSLGAQAFVTAFTSFAAGVLAVNDSLVTVIDFVLAPGSQLGPASATVGMTVDFSVAPPDSYSPDQVRWCLHHGLSLGLCHAMPCMARIKVT